MAYLPHAHAIVPGIFHWWTMCNIETFKRNIQLLMIDVGLSYEELAERIGNKCTAAWLRKIVHKGITKRTTKNEPWLQKMVEIFKCKTVDDLWDWQTIRLDRTPPYAPTIWSIPIAPPPPKPITLLERLKRMHAEANPEPSQPPEPTPNDPSRPDFDF